MIRTATFAAGLLALAGAANAAILGAEVRERTDDTWFGAFSTDDVFGFDSDNARPANHRIFDIYAKFDSNGQSDTVLSVGQLDLVTSWGLNADQVAGGASIYSPDVVIPFPPSSNPLSFNVAGSGATPSGLLGTWMTIGADPDGAFAADIGQIQLDPDFAYNGATEQFTGGWFNSNPGNPTGVPQFNADKGTFEVLLARVAVTGLDAGTTINAPANGTNADFTLLGDLFSGSFEVFLQDPAGGSQEPVRITFDIPTPGAAALFGLAGFVAVRRRR